MRPRGVVLAPFLGLLRIGGVEEDLLERLVAHPPVVVAGPGPAAVVPVVMMRLKGHRSEEDDGEGDERGREGYGAEPAEDVMGIPPSRARNRHRRDERGGLSRHVDDAPGLALPPEEVTDVACENRPSTDAVSELPGKTCANGVRGLPRHSLDTVDRYR